MAKNDPPSADIIRHGFGTRLRSLRQTREWEPKQAAKRLDILYSRYMKYEEALREPPFWLLVRMAGLYSVTTDLLLIGPAGTNQKVFCFKARRLIFLIFYIDLVSLKIN